MAVPDRKDNAKSKRSALSLLRVANKGAINGGADKVAGRGSNRGLTTVDINRMSNGIHRGMDDGVSRGMPYGIDRNMINNRVISVMTYSADKGPSNRVVTVMTYNPDKGMPNGARNQCTGNKVPNIPDYKAHPVVNTNVKETLQKKKGENDPDVILKRLKGFVVSAQRLIPEKEFLFGRKNKVNACCGKEAKAKAACQNDMIKAKEKGSHEAKLTGSSLHKKTSFIIPDNNDIHCYYEFESVPYGCMKLKHRQCPQGQFFSLKHMKCLKMCYWKTRRRKKSSPSPGCKKVDLPEPSSDDQEPSNEWLDAPQNGATQKIPSEFKPKRKPTLKIYHLRVRRKPGGSSCKKHPTGKRHALSNLGSTSAKSQRRRTPKGLTKRRGYAHRHHPRSFLIRINKKEGKHNQEGITENDENDSDEDNEEGDEEDDEDEDAEEDEEEPDDEENAEENAVKTPGKISRKDTIKEFFRSAKAAVTNRAKFTEPSVPATLNTNKNTPNKVDEQAEKCKQILLDANIKVDSAFSSALKNMLRSKQKVFRDNPAVASDGLIRDRGSQDQMDPELLRVYQHLIRNDRK